MRWRDALHPVAMQRVALVAPRDALRDLLVVVADTGTVELDDSDDEAAQPLASPAADRLQRLPSAGVTRRSPRASRISLAGSGGSRGPDCR